MATNANEHSLNCYHHCLLSRHYQTCSVVRSNVYAEFPENYALFWSHLNFIFRFKKNP